ncbi:MULTISPECIES: OprD family outer membrane porin [unclassified Acinetobacter]|uniref:OprD family outer membrane porin n=1 Tax=unclassified Acinetobacter TaxID=196816 RepID=UPI0029343124|nr:MULTISPECIES: OprD family outer membrane porin [unclassified Acinetobacter]WOE30550.1 OprD family outer membrane porin [Acinetobacter sp. SAAs470]WOE38742.1 OprD family outer membrane porin [Acinetobacter sp. SAAs474]
MRRQTLWIALFAATATLGTSAVYADFIDDSQVQLKLRNFYLDRQYADAPQNDWGSWSQGVTLDAKSGYYDLGGVEVGVDLLAQYAFKLKQLHDKPDFVLKYDGDKAKSGFGKIGATLKAKVSQTELKVGELLPVSPVLVYDPSRQLLTTFSGAWLESKEIKNTKLTLAYVNRINNRYDDSFERLTKFSPPQYDNGPAADGMWIAGVDYQFNKQWGASYWFANVEDIYKQNYVGVNYNTNLTDQTKLSSYARYFDNSASSNDLYGKIDNQAVSLSGKVVHGSHTVALGYQQMFGENAFPTLGGWVPQPYLVNWGVATFTNAKEKSWGFTYAYDFSGLGIKGFNTTATYFTGYGAEVAGKKDQKSNELNLIVNYTVPEGKLKGLGVQAMYIDADFDWKTDLKEYRIATTYNYKF